MDSVESEEFLELQERVASLHAERDALLAACRIDVEQVRGELDRLGLPILLGI